jgi:hypothetical protein
LSFAKRFGSVTVLNGHIHQIMQKIEGTVSFHTAMSTAFPQPAPGTAPSAGPMKVPAEQLQRVLGITDVNYLVSGRSLAVVDSPLADSGSMDSGSRRGAVSDLTIGQIDEVRSIRKNHKGNSYKGEENDKEKHVDCKCDDAGSDSTAAAVSGIGERLGE